MRCGALGSSHMIVLATAIVVAASLPAAATATVQATATIRVERAFRVRLDGSFTPGANPPRVSHVKLADGSSQTVRVIEFE